MKAYFISFVSSLAFICDTTDSLHYMLMEDDRIGTLPPASPGQNMQQRQKRSGISPPAETQHDALGETDTTPFTQGETDFRCQTAPPDLEPDPLDVECERGLSHRPLPRRTRAAG